MFGPASLPKHIVDKRSAAMQKMLNRPDVRERMLTNYIEPTPSDPATFRTMVRRQRDVWGGKSRMPASSRNGLRRMQI